VNSAAQASSRDGLLHIGAVCRRLRDEFPDVSISKIRYLEDQGLIAPKRTQGGYRLFDDDALDRLRTILRLQRDEFLPLRVIRQELASPAAGKTRRQRRAAGLAGPEEELDVRELVVRSGATPHLLKELVGPSLRSRSPERREAALEDLRTLAELAQELSQLLSWRALRQIASR